MAENRVVIVGGGISGLSAAYYLQKQAFDVTLVEQSPRLGGLIRTDFLDGCRLEAGPDSYIVTKPAVATLAAELGTLSSQIISANDVARRVFIAKNKQLVSMPKGMTLMVPGAWKPVLSSRLFTVATKLRYLRELRYKPQVRLEDLSIEQFVVEHFGREVLETLAEPLLSGVYGGDVRKLSALSVLPNLVEYERSSGSLIRGVRAARGKVVSGGLFRSFRDGMQSLPDHVALAIRERVHLLQGRAGTVERDGERWRIRVGQDWLTAKHAVIAVPAYDAARILSDVAPSIREELLAIPYSSAILVMLVFNKSDIHHGLDGFGFLVPRAEREAIAAATWVSTKFPSRVPPDRIAIRGFIVGSEAERLQNASDGEVYAAVSSDIRRFMGIDVAPILSTLTRWPDSMPQYVVGHSARVARINQQLTRFQGLHLIGNSYEGVGTPDCIRLAANLANNISVCTANN